MIAVRKTCTTWRRAPRAGWLLALACAFGAAACPTTPTKPTALDEPPVAAAAAGDLSGADCDIWIYYDQVQEVYMRLNSETKPGPAAPLQPLKVLMNAVAAPWCVGGVELPMGQKSELVMSLNDDGTLASVELGGQPVTYDGPHDSDLTSERPVVFGVVMPGATPTFVLHVHYADIEVRIDCVKGSCP